jgi:hypothetical protein
MLPAISVKQHWASMIASGEKSIETRTWYTQYRGPLVICSSALPKGEGVTRRAVCVVLLLHCREMTVEDERLACCPIYERAKAWVLSRERRVTLKAMSDVRGRLGIWPLSLPEYEFYCPEDRDTVGRWLDWSKEKGFLDLVKETG